MSSSQKSSKSNLPPLSRWKGRLHIFNKPTFWISTAVLLLIGLLIADYYRVQMSQVDIEKQIELAREREDQEEGDRQDFSSSPEYGDASQPATLDGIPLPDDPELREWAIREANDLNPDSELELDGRNASPDDRSHQNRPSSEEQQENTLALDEPARLITNTDDSGDNEPEDGSRDVNTRRNRRNRQDNRADSLFPDYAKNADDVLSLMGLNSPRSQGSGGDIGALATPPSANGNALDLFAGTNDDSLPPSALAQALQDLAIDSSIANATMSLPNEAVDLSSQASDQSLEGIPIFQQPSIQTSPSPGTTGYMAPPPLPTVAAPGTAIAPTPGIPTSSITISPPIGTPPNGALGSALPSTTLAPQPTVALPQPSVPQALPTPAFVSPPPIEHTPYAGGGRNGEINTFSNP